MRVTRNVNFCALFVRFLRAQKNNPKVADIENDNL